MEKHKILGLTLLGAGAAAAGLGIYGTVQALQLNNQTSDTKAKESKAMNNVIDSVYGSTESSAKAMGTASGLLAGAAAGGGLILLTTGGLLLSPLGIKMKQMKLAKMGAISLAVIAGGAPVLGAIGTGLFYTDQVQQAKQFLDFSADFEKEFMGNINAVETSARNMLEDANWIKFAERLEQFKTDASVFKISAADKATDAQRYYDDNYLLAANMYVLGGKDTLNNLGAIIAPLKPQNWYSGFDWGNTGYGEKLAKLLVTRDGFSSKILNEAEDEKVLEAAKKSVEWFKNAMKKYNSDFGVEATDQVVALTLAKLAYVSGNKNLHIGTVKPTNAADKNTTFSGTVDYTDLIPSSLSHFKNISGIKESNGHLILEKDLDSTIGIDELTKQYKPNWLNDPLKYVFTEPGAGRVELSRDSIKTMIGANENPFINEEWLAPFFENGHKIYIDNSISITDFMRLDGAVKPSLIGAMGSANTNAAFNVVLPAVHSSMLSTWQGRLTQTKSSYFLQMKLTLAKNYVQSVMNEISDTLTNHATDIYA